MKRKEPEYKYRNVMLIDADGQATRVGIRIDEKDGKRTKVRISKKTGSVI